MIKFEQLLQKIINLTYNAPLVFIGAVKIIRRDGRVVECTGLENQQRGDSFESSNLSPSAINYNKRPLSGLFYFSLIVTIYIGSWFFTDEM